MNTFDRLALPIATPHFLLRRVAEGDLADLLVVHADDEVTAYLPYETWRSPADAQAWLARVRGLEESGRSIQLVVVDRADDRVIGAVVLFNLEAVSARVELGYVLGQRDWGRGVLRELLPILIGRVFANLELRRIEAFADADNVASDRLLARLGFAREGTMRQRDLLKGRLRDVALYGLLADDPSV